MWWLCEM